MNHVDSPALSIAVTLIPFGFFFLWLGLRSSNPNAVVPFMSKTKVALMYAIVLCVITAVTCAACSVVYRRSGWPLDSPALSIAVTLIPFWFFFLWLGLRSSNPNAVLPLMSRTKVALMYAILLFIVTAVTFAAYAVVYRKSLWPRTPMQVTPPPVTVRFAAPPKSPRALPGQVP